MIGEYIRDHVASWFNWAQTNRLGVEHMEDLIFVTGCTLVTSWAAVAFMENTTDAEITLVSGPPINGGTNFYWDDIRGTVVFRNSYFYGVRSLGHVYSARTDVSLLYKINGPPARRDQCVFIRGFRVKRVRFRTRIIRAAAEPLPDDPDNHRDDEIQVTQVPVQKVCRLLM